MAFQIGNGPILGPSIEPAVALAAAAANRLDAAGEMLGASFIAPTTSPIQAVDVNLIVALATGLEFTVEVQTDSANAPSGTILGAASAAFAGPAASGWTGLRTLGTNTGNLVVGTKYWVVVRCATGTPDSTHYIAFARSGSAELLGCFNRHHNGTNWTTTTVYQQAVMFACQHVSGAYTGIAVTAGNQLPATAPDVYDTNRQGVRFTCGAQIAVQGVSAVFNITGTPDAITVKLYQDGVEKASSAAIAAAMVADDFYHTFYFATPVLIPSGTTIDILFSQAGTSDSHDYDLRGYTFNTTYAAIAKPGAAWAMVYGTNPASLSVESGFVPVVYLLLSDMATDFDEAAAGGGLLLHPGMAGGLHA